MSKLGGVEKDADGFCLFEANATAVGRRGLIFELFFQEKAVKKQPHIFYGTHSLLFLLSRPIARSQE
jgi:hypothetical protein